MVPYGLIKPGIDRNALRNVEGLYRINEPAACALVLLALSHTFGERQVPVMLFAPCGAPVTFPQVIRFRTYHLFKIGIAELGVIRAHASSSH